MEGWGDDGSIRTSWEVSVRPCTLVQVSLLITLAACASNASHPEIPSNYSLTLELIRRAPACAPLVATGADWTRWPLDRPKGEIGLPPGLRPGQGKGIQQAWGITDTTELLYWASEQPFGGFASSGGMLAHLHKPSMQSEPECRLVLSGHEALIHRSVQVDSAGADTVFLFGVTIPFRSDLTVEWIGMTVDGRMRDSLMAAVSAVKWNSPP